MPVAKGAAASLAPPVAQTPQGPTPRSARSGAGTVTPNVLTVRRHVRFDDKLMESPREPRVPLPAGQVWQHAPILKHRPTEPVTQEPTSLDAQDPGTARRSPSPPTARIEGAEAPRVMDSARMASGEPMVRQEAQEAHGGLQLPRWAHASPPAAPQLIHVAPQVPGRLQAMTGQVVQPLQPWLIRTQPSPGMPQGRGYGAPPVPIRRVEPEEGNFQEPYEASEVQVHRRQTLLEDKASEASLVEVRLAVLGFLEVEVGKKGTQ
eukprot:symbB.v1.2.020631.t2/scaffold1744.1/size103388/6